jgi:uncharacterized membrane protein YdbT with pleckstrin-like domain
MIILNYILIFYFIFEFLNFLSVINIQYKILKKEQIRIKKGRIRIFEGQIRTKFFKYPAELSSRD